LSSGVDVGVNGSVNTFTEPSPIKYALLLFAAKTGVAFKTLTQISEPA